MEVSFWRLGEDEDAGQKTDLLFDRMADALKEMAGVWISRPTKLAEMRVRGLVGFAILRAADMKKSTLGSDAPPSSIAAPAAIAAGTSCIELFGARPRQIVRFVRISAGQSGTGWGERGAPLSPPRASRDLGAQGPLSAAAPGGLAKKGPDKPLGKGKRVSARKQASKGSGGEKAMDLDP
ncbi:hypothetical protein RF55_8004 [Lasius niger]|uniref:Uncharacterized protein n=1 Tax=Lasius niger TaxID=67767 RepID=A0A0J7KNZ9_LASNI|nr:hypothetical protein RF55_8004 [Lasius niger]